MNLVVKNEHHKDSDRFAAQMKAQDKLLHLYIQLLCAPRELSGKKNEDHKDADRCAAQMKAVVIKQPLRRKSTLSTTRKAQDKLLRLYI